MARIMYGPVCRDRIRFISKGFGWVDHRLVRRGYLERCSVHALALYLFLVTVADADGVSFWGDESVRGRLSMTAQELRLAREELVAAELIAYEKPVSQVLQLSGGE